MLLLPLIVSPQTCRLAQRSRMGRQPGCSRPWVLCGSPLPASRPRILFLTQPPKNKVTPPVSSFAISSPAESSASSSASDFLLAAAPGRLTWTVTFTTGLKSTHASTVASEPLLQSGAQLSPRDLVCSRWADLRVQQTRPRSGCPSTTAGTRCQPSSGNESRLRKSASRHCRPLLIVMVMDCCPLAVLPRAESPAAA